MRAFTLLIIILLSFNAHAQRKGLVSSDKLLQLALQETNEHRNYNKAIALCKKGLAQSPGYTDIRLLLGKLYMLTGRPAAARSEWQGVLKKEPANIDALHYLVNLEYSQHHIKETMDHINTALRISPEDKVLLLKKYGILQESKQWEEQAKLLALMHFYFPDDKKTPQQHDARLYVINLEAGKGNYQQSIAYCDSALAQLGHDSLLVQKRNALWQEVNEKAIAHTPADTPATEKKYHNQAGVIHLQSIYGNGNRPASITSLQYLRYHDRGSVTGRVNYADRASGNGLQLEAETYYDHNPRYYSYGLLGWSDAAVFPKFRAGYSLFRNFKKGWEGELGARYLRADSVNTWSAVWSAGKYWGNNWTNLRGYVITEQNKWYQAYTLTHRMYLHDDKEFIAFLLSLGTTPDDRSRNFQFNRFVSFISKSAGIGYQKIFGSRTTASIYGNWINQRTGNKKYYNQYDIYLTLLYKF